MGHFLVLQPGCSTPQSFSWNRKQKQEKAEDVPTKSYGRDGGLQRFSGDVIKSQVFVAAVI